MMEKNDQEFRNKVISTVRECKSATLITMSKEGFPRARVMEDHNPHTGFVFWFATHSSTRKVTEISNHPEVSIYYLMPEADSGFICILGRAEIKTDLGSRKYLWREKWKEYWPEGPDAEEYIPIRIIPQQAEYYNMKEGAFTNEGYAPLIFDSSIFTKTAPESPAREGGHE